MRKASKYQLAIVTESFSWMAIILAADITWVTSYLDHRVTYESVSIELLEKDCTEVDQFFGARMLDWRNDGL